MFDRVVVVDWSASSTPKRGRDSIWIGVGERGSVSTTNWATRHDAAKAIEELTGRQGRTLVGVDFSLGYPAGTASALGLRGAPWWAMWSMLAQAIVDDERNRNNRFAVAADLNRRMSGAARPFWGCPPSQRSRTLMSTKSDPAPLSEWRTVESELRSHGLRPFSSWQLLGAGSVGSQSLLGIPMLYDLVRSCGDDVDVWPFTSGLSVPERSTVIAEVWPSMSGPLSTESSDGERVRDDLQVDLLARRLAAADLAALFVPSVPEQDREHIVSEEGWVLGA